MLNNKVIYLPALMAERTTKKHYKHKNTKSFRFYTDDNPIFYYPHFLISAGLLLPQKTIIKDLKYDLSKGIVLGDSGGWQLNKGSLTYSKNIVESILYWLEENTNYAMNIDFPPDVDSKWDTYIEKLKISKYNYEYFAEHKKNKTKLMNVIHGTNLKRLNTWYDAVKDFEFEGGWGLGSSKSTFYFILTFFFLYEKGEIDKFNSKSYINPLFHLLGFSKTKEIPLLFYIQEKLNKLDKNITLTFDSSSPFKTAAFGNYYFWSYFFDLEDKRFNSITLSSNILKNKSNYNKDVLLPCNCPICKDITFGDVIELLNNEEKTHDGNYYLYLGCHNLYLMLDYVENMSRIIRTESKEIINSYFSEKMIGIFSIIDKAFNEDKPAEYIYKQKQALSILLEEPDLVKNSLF
jgi:hypothetical protein